MRRIMPIVLAVVMVMMSGCMSVNRDRARGIVAYGDTNLGLWATITLNGHTVTTDNGWFVIPLEAGSYAFRVSTLLGEYEGSVYYDGRSNVRLEVPAFDGWSRSAFDELLTVTSTSGTWTGTMRWARYVPTFSCVLIMR